MIWGERKVVSGMHNRIGPNKAGPFGLLQSLADGIKAFFKETFRPSKSDPFIYKLAPYLMFVPAFLIWSVLPLGGDFTNGNDGTITIFGQVTRVQLADPPIGILLVLAMSSIAVYGVMLAGWASGSKYPLLGAVRGSAQMISYEAALGPEPRRRAAVERHAQHGRHRPDAEQLRRLEHRRDRHRAVRDLPDRRPPPNSTGRRSTSSKPSRNSCRASTPSTAASASPCSSSPSS